MCGYLAPPAGAWESTTSCAQGLASPSLVSPQGLTGLQLGSQAPYGMLGVSISHSPSLASPVSKAVQSLGPGPPNYMVLVSHPPRAAWLL